MVGGGAKGKGEGGGVQGAFPMKGKRGRVPWSRGRGKATCGLGTEMGGKAQDRVI